MSLILTVLAAVLASCCCCCTRSSAATTDTVSARQPLQGNQTAVSAQGKFELGLFSPGGSGRFYLGIWYKNVPVQTVIWVANRATPLSNAASAELRVSPDDGNLQLVGLTDRSAAPSLVWSSNLSSPSSSPGSSVALMRDNGNLVLVDGGNSSDVLWQSFDHPTDTLVPEAWLGENKLTGEYQTLTSWRNAEDPAPGKFTDTVDPAGSSEFFYLWNGSRAYWRSGVWTGRVFARLPDGTRNVLFNQSYVETPAYRRVTSVLYDNATITRMVLDLTGQTKQYIWVANSQSWQLFWTAPTVQCDVYAVCGAYGVCDQRSQPSCRCPPGFAPALERDWGLSDWSGGCRRNAPLWCAPNGSTDGFLELPDMKLPDNSLAVSAQSRAECESACLKNCSCQAYTFSGGGRGCAVWHGDFRNLYQLYADAGSSGSSLYLRLSESGLRDMRNANRKKGRLWIVLGIVLACLAALGASALLAWVLLSRRKQGLANMANDKGSALAVYSYGDLRAATRNFSEWLGGGGFGSVYRGVLKNGGTEVAVKKLEGLRQGDKQFRSEVSTLGLIQHVNLVRLLGFCSSADDKLLVYEYMPNGSLHGYLFGGSACPSWRDRYSIMLGVARGLAYLHDGCRDCIIHCDIKPGNILLDEDLCPKIADFGMAKLVGRDFSRALTTMRGTVGYLAPEWISGLPISAKADVYSFGMVLFELISGRRNTEGSSPGGDSNVSDAEEVAGRRGSIFFPVWAAGKVAEGEVVAVADPRLCGDVREQELERACRVACWCIQDQEAHRPTMAQVVQALEGVVDVDVPPVPQALQHLVDREISVQPGLIHGGEKHVRRVQEFLLVVAYLAPDFFLLPLDLLPDRLPPSALAPPHTSLPPHRHHHAPSSIRIGASLPPHPTSSQRGSLDSLTQNNSPLLSLAQNVAAASPIERRCGLSSHHLRPPLLSTPPARRATREGRLDLSCRRSSFFSSRCFSPSSPWSSSSCGNQRYGSQILLLYLVVGFMPIVGRSGCHVIFLGENGRSERKNDLKKDLGENPLCVVT